MLGDFRKKAGVELFVFRREVIGIEGKLVLVPGCFGHHFGNTFLISPIGRFRAGLKGEINRELLLISPIDRCIHRTEVKNSRLFLHFIPRGVKTRSPQKRVFNGILSLATIPYPEGIWTRGGLDC